MPSASEPRNPKSRRKPGRLVRIKQLLPKPLPKTASLQELRDYVVKVQEVLEAIANSQDDLNRMEWFRYDSLPGKHGLTHMGGDDSVAGAGLPQPVGPPGTLPQRGDPHLGFSPHNHIHELDLGPIDTLLDVAVDIPYGLLVTDPKLQDALQEIVLQLTDVGQLLLEQESTATVASGDGDDILAFLGM